MRALTLILGLTTLVPSVALAQSPPANFGPIGTYVSVFMGFINNFLTPLVFAVSFIVLIFGLFRFFIYKGHDEDGQEQGRKLAIYGILGFVIMVSVWGLVNVVATGLGFAGANAPRLPVIPMPGAPGGTVTPAPAGGAVTAPPVIPAGAPGGNVPGGSIPQGQ